MEITTLIECFFWLLVAHALSDWCWQSSFVSENKDKRVLVMLMHCLAWGGCLCLPLYYFHLFVWWKAPFLVLFHAPADYAKSWILNRQHNQLCAKADPNVVEKAWRLVYIDQVYHLIQMIIVLVF